MGKIKDIYKFRVVIMMRLLPNLLNLKTKEAWDHFYKVIAEEVDKINDNRFIHELMESFQSGKDEIKEDSFTEEQIEILRDFYNNVKSSYISYIIEQQKEEINRGAL